MAFAAWLIAKGFDQLAIQGYAPELRMDMTKTAGGFIQRPQPTA